MASGRNALRPTRGRRMPAGSQAPFPRYRVLARRRNGVPAKPSSAVTRTRGILAIHICSIQRRLPLSLPCSTIQPNGPR
jgi:hypothetical protein